ncbi:unnamed protein product [Hermetia illucens]|uniref:Uncharacterized protein n=1 Tax=Hermetia illucens TaxID=343691 RepID=A0A7R8YLT8_HERIL|nr:unnamed protein product [Hermetia illucens]
MFRQIKVAPKDQDYQRILWGKNKYDLMEEYRLNTVNYGAASARFLAIRTMIQLAKDEDRRYPIAIKVLQRYFYVDHLMIGTEKKEAPVQLYPEIKGLPQSSS